MSELVVRRLLVDLETPFPVQWIAGDAFLSAFFNAMSMSFPSGEQFFIDSVRLGLKQLPPEQADTFAQEIRRFVGQESTHRRLHALFNANLIRQGLDNAWERRSMARVESLRNKDPRHWVGVTAASEHLTALFGEWVLRHPELFAGVEPRLSTLWAWHCAEECEHRSTAFDLYRALGGNLKWRKRWGRLATFYFMCDLARQTLDNLHRGGQLWRWSTWRSAARWLFARDGLIRENLPYWREFFQPNFHPSRLATPAGEQWLRDNRAAYLVVGEPAPAVAPSAATLEPV